MTQAASNFLVEAAYADSTRQRYSSAVKNFVTWLDSLDLDLPDDPDQLDDLVTEFLHFTFERRDGVGKGEASQLVYGLAMVFPKLRHKLPVAKLALRGWHKLKPAQDHCVDGGNRRASVDPAFLDLASRYANPAALLKPSPTPQPLSRPLLFTSQAEYLKLLKRMLAADMLAFTTEPACVNGVFAVPKGDQQRLIINAVPANALFVEPPAVSLPTPDVVASLVLLDAASFYVGKIDLANFYHQLRLPVWMQRYFALPPVDAASLGLPDTGQVFPCCTTLPMGFSHSVFLAQALHVHFLENQVLLPPQDSVQSSTDCLLDRLRYIVYIDDLVLISPSKADVDAAIDNYLAACSKAGLLVKFEKLLLGSRHGVEVLGLECHGSHLTLGLHPSKLALLIDRTWAILDADESTGSAISQLIGSWTWAMISRRPSLSIFASVYRFAAIARDRVFSLWQSVRRELTIVAGLAPLFFTSFGPASAHSPAQSRPVQSFLFSRNPDNEQGFFDRVVATDASESGLGVVAVRSPEAVAEFAFSGQRAPMTEAAEQTVSTAQQRLLRRLRWSQIVSSRWREEEHINSLEMRSAMVGVRWALSMPSARGKRLVLLSDSSVVVGALNKGRSSSWILLRQLRFLTALLFACDVRLLTCWIPSRFNPADDASRQ